MKEEARKKSQVVGMRGRGNPPRYRRGAARTNRTVCSRYNRNDRSAIRNAWVIQNAMYLICERSRCCLLVAISNKPFIFHQSHFIYFTLAFAFYYRELK